MSKPEIIISNTEGFHNSDLTRAQERLLKGKTYKDLSTVCVIPSRGDIPARAVESWMNLMTPMNNRFLRMFINGMEVGDAYEAAVETILGNPFLRDFKYMLTLETDNLPPPDGLLKLYEHIDKFQVVAGLYWTKGEGGQPMIYGNPKEPLSFMPQLPKPDAIQECNGTGMGFTLWDLAIFKDKRLERPWFKTVQEYTYGQGASAGTQDLYCMGKLRKLGYRIASDNRVRVGHVDTETGVVW